MTTTQGSQLRPTQGPSNRYAIPLELHYKAISKHGPLYGSGQTRMVNIVFAPGDRLESGMIAEIASPGLFFWTIIFTCSWYSARLFLVYDVNVSAACDLIYLTQHLMRCRLADLT